MLAHAEPAAVPPACTTAAAVRTHACEPAMEILAISNRELVLLRELVTLRARRVELARDIAGFTDTAAQRLDRAERTRSYPTATLVSEDPNWRTTADNCIAALRVLAHPPRRPGAHAAAREMLHGTFETFGSAMFAIPTFTDRLGIRHTIELKGEFDRWQS